MNLNQNHEIFLPKVWNWMSWCTSIRLPQQHYNPCTCTTQVLFLRWSELSLYLWSLFCRRNSRIFDN